MRQLEKLLMLKLGTCILLLVCCADGNKNPLPSTTTGEGKFSNPILTSAPDPWVYQKDNYYYVTHTTGNSIRLYKTEEMSDLKQASVKTIWTPPVSGMNAKNIWAPEIHFINNKWYCYYAADNGENENHRVWILENSNPDPFAGTWEDRGELELPDDKWAIDASVFFHQDNLYVVWSGWEGDVNVRQDIYIARMTDAITVEEPRVRISTPELAWELHGGTPTINEAPQVLMHNNKIFITYSASGCWTDDYALGLLTADSNADLLNPTSWSKSSQPVFTKNISNQVFGPGHNSFFKSKDGTEDWILYHANAEASQGCGNKRSMRMQKFTWENDIPRFGNPAALGASLDVPSGEN